MTAVRAPSRRLPSWCRSAADAPSACAERRASSAARACPSRSSNWAATATSAACLSIASLLTGLRLAITALSLVHPFRPRPLPCEVVPAEPPPAEQDEHPADPGPHQVPEPLAHGGDPAAGPAREELEREHGRDHDAEYDNGENASRHDD